MSLREASGGDAGGVLSATGDVLSAVVSLWVVFALPLAVGNRLLGNPLSTWVVERALFVTAITGAYPFVAGYWPLAKLTDFALAAVVAAFGQSALVGVGLFASGRSGLPSDGPLSTAISVAVIAVSFAVAALYVRHREHTHAAGDDADDN
jgi:hypothetical protein